ncbi:triose-phosphate isomerase [Candidatus Microgenomates bacterium]|nr:triose-phosphate isomerase [Candidatus Microgenomates bacterium]
MKYLIANLKEHQSLEEAVTWINKFVNTLRANSHVIDALRSERVQVVLAPSAPFLVTFKSSVHEFPNVLLASQDVSGFMQGSYTGETGGHTLRGIVSYAIIGHSERRRYLGETNELVRTKMQNAQTANILPILCVRGSEDVLHIERGMVAYEPADAIGTGKNYPVETVEIFRKQMQLPVGIPFLYGGSVDSQNMRLYLKSPHIDGLLVGTASLDASQVNILLLGVPGGDHDGPNLSDSINVMSYDMKTNQLTTIGIPRDVWSETLHQKINAAYATGEAIDPGKGMTLAKAEVSSIVGIPIDICLVIPR